MMVVTVIVASAKGTSEAISKDFSVGVFGRMHSSDPGIQWILDSYKRNFLAQHVDLSSKAVVEDFSFLEVDDVSVGLFDALGEKPKMLLVADILPTDATVSFKVKNVNFKLNIKERSQEKGLQPAVVKALLGALVKASDKTYLDNDLAYSASMQEQGKICAYAVVKDRAIVANDLALAKQALASTLEGVALPPSPELKDFLDRFDKPQDFLIYLNNAQGFLARLNDRLEKKLQIPILSGVDSIRCVGIYVDIVDKNHIEIRGTFVLTNPDASVETMQDVSFLAEFLRRKMLREGVCATIRMDQGPGKVQVHVGFSNTEDFLTKYLKKGSINKSPTAE